MKKWWQKILAWIKEQFANNPEPDDNPTPLPQPEPKPEDDYMKTEMDNGFSHGAKIVAEIDLHHVNKSGIFFSAQKRGWKVVDGCNGEAHLFVRRYAAWKGGKFDHVKPNSTSRDWKNLNPENPYGIFKEIGAPKPGEKIAFMLISYDKKERTNAVFAEYP